VLFPLYGGCILLILLGAVTAQGATYYVATTGSDANPGTSDRPWRNPQKCVDADSPLVAGDTCLVGNGTYTSTTSGRVVVIAGSSPAGTSTNRITIKSANPLGATINIPNTWPGANCDVDNCAFSAIFINRPYYVIEGFQITRTGSSYGTSASVIGIYIEGSDGSNTVVRKNHFHDIGRTVCHNGLLGIAGVYIDYSSNVTIEENRFNTIGRLRNGENGCVTDKLQHDHGVYANGTTDLMIRRNVFYDVNRGLPVNAKAYSGLTTRLKIYNNVLSGKSPTGLPNGQIALTNTFSDVQVKNNIFHDPPQGYVFWWYFNSVVSGLVIDHNLSNSTLTDLTNPHFRPSSGITYTNNITNTNPGFVNAGANDFRLASGSTAINAGINVGLPFNGSAPDIGTYEFSEQDGDPPLAPKGLTIQ
jgi:hypothetical protein